MSCIELDHPSSPKTELIFQHLFAVVNYLLYLHFRGYTLVIFPEIMGKHSDELITVMDSLETDNYIVQQLLNQNSRNFCVPDFEF